MPARRGWAAALLFTAAVSLLLSFTRVASWDVFWHLRTGEVILETGRLVRTNLFSDAFRDYPWPNPEWLFQVVLAALHGWKGWPAVAGLKVSLTLLLGVLLLAVMRRRGGSSLPAAAFTAVALCGLQFRLTARPHLFSFVLFSLVMLVVEVHRRRGGRLVWSLPPLFALWSNIHPELVMGLLYLGAVVAGDAARPPGPERPRRVDMSLAGAALLSIPATLLNPEGHHVITFPFMHTFFAPGFVVTEYQPAFFGEFPLFWAAAALTAGVLLLSRARREWSEFLLCGGFGLMGALYQRSTPYFFLVAAVTLHRHVEAGAFAGFSLPRRRRGLAAAAVAALALAWAIGGDRLMPYRWGAGIEEELYPVAAANLLASGEFPGRLYNTYNHGGYLLWRLYPKMGVFQDGRVQAYPPAFVARLHAKESLDDWRRLLEEYDVRTALVPRGMVESHFTPEEWGMVFWDDRWAVMLRRLPETRALLRTHEYRFFLPAAPVGDVREPLKLEAMLSEMKRNQQARLHPSVDVENLRGTVELRLGRREAAEAAFRRAVAIDDRYAPAWANLGIVLAAGGRSAEAAAAVERARRLDPSLPGPENEK